MSGLASRQGYSYTDLSVCPRHYPDRPDIMSGQFRPAHWIGLVFLSDRDIMNSCHGQISNKKKVYTDSLFEPYVMRFEIDDRICYKLSRTVECSESTSICSVYISTQCLQSVCIHICEARISQTWKYWVRQVLMSGLKSSMALIVVFSKCSTVFESYATSL